MSPNPSLQAFTGSATFATPNGNPFCTVVAGEIGMFLLIGSAGLLVGFLLRRIFGGVRLLSVLMLALVLLAWAGGVGISTAANIPSSVDLLGLFRPLCDAWNQNVSWTPLRAGVGALGFVAGLCLDLRERRSVPA